MKTRKARRLEKLRITSVDTVPAGAAVGARILLAKRFAFNDADSLIPAKPKKKRAKAKRVSAKAAAKAAKKSLLKLMQRQQHIEPVALEEEHPVNTSVSKAVRDMNLRVDEILKSDSSIRSRESAIAKVASGSSGDPRDRQIWKSFKQESWIEEIPLEEPPAAQSDAYEALMVKAEALANREGLSVPSAFAKIYADPANRALVQADKAAAFAKMTGQTELAEAAAVRTAHQIVEDERQAHIDKAAIADAELLAKALDPDFVFNNLLSALRASYGSTMSDDRLRTLARQIQAKMPPLDRLGRARGYSGSAA